MEDFSYTKLKNDETSGLNLSDIPRSIVIESTADYLTSQSKKQELGSPIKFVNQSFNLSSHTRCASSLRSVTPKASFIGEKKHSSLTLKKLDKRLNKISEELKSENKETGFDTFRDRETGRGLTDRGTFARPEESLDYRVPTLKWCAYCVRETSTELEYRNCQKTLWSSVGIFLMGGVFGCFMLPYLSNSCKELILICHVCKREISKCN